ncbi:MAG: C25 family cysteine peptidase, partial [Anaerolineales bacterium]
PVSYANAVTLYEADYGCTAFYECAAAKTALINNFNETGVVIANYIGHASVNYWSYEDILTLTDIPLISNPTMLPVILSMTCLDGYWSGPIYTTSKNQPVNPGLIETLVRKSDSGAIAAFSPTGLGVSTGHDILQKGFYDSLMNAGHWEMGIAALNAKLALFTVGIHPDLLHTYTVFGDPALQIRNPFRMSATPADSIRFTETPGAVLTHQITVQNTGTTTDSYLVEVSGNTWQTTLPYTTTVQISPGAQITIPIEVQTPNPGFGSDNAVVTITSVGNRALVFESHLTTQIITEIFEIFLPLTTK